jgi:HD superfamily phosphohydrolase
MFATLGRTSVVELKRLDCIHHYIDLDEKDFPEIQNEFVQREIARLEKLAHLGLIRKTRRFARHDKLEHAFGVCWLCKLCIDKTRGLIRDKKAFLIAGLMHGIGHLPFSYDTEYAVAKLYEIHPPTRDWLNNAFDKCVEFTNTQGVRNAAADMKSVMDYFMLHRWFTALKIVQSKHDEFNNQLGKNIVGILVDPELLEHQLLSQLDRMDYILRDMHYLAHGRIELNFSPLLEEFRKGPDGQLISPRLFKLIEVTNDYLADEVYLGAEERCLAQILEKTLVRQVVDGHTTIKAWLLMTDDEFEDKLLRSGSGDLVLAQAMKRIKERKLAQIAQVACDRRQESIVEMEMKLCGTNTRGIHNYSQEKGIYIQCIPDPYYTDTMPYEYAESGVWVGIAYDFDSGCPQHVIGALIKAEEWVPANLYGIEIACREDALRYLIGLDVQPHFDRYDDYVRKLIMKHLPRVEDDWKPELFRENWRLREQAVVHLYYEYDANWPREHFLHFPEHWSTKIITAVLNEVRRFLTKTKRRPSESEQAYLDRKDRLLEYSSYLETVLRIREHAVAGWVLPSVWILNESGDKDNEVDVIAVYVPKPHYSPITVELLEVSNNDTDDNRLKNRKKLDKIAERVKGRFGRKVHVIGRFNGQEIVHWPPASQTKSAKRD